MSDPKEALLLSIVRELFDHALEDVENPLRELATLDDVHLRSSQLYYLGLGAGLALARLNARWVLAYAEGSEILDEWTLRTASVLLHDLQELAARQGLAPTPTEPAELAPACASCGCCPALFQVACVGCAEPGCTTEPIAYCDACLAQMALGEVAMHRQERTQRRHMKEREN